MVWHKLINQWIGLDYPNYPLGKTELSNQFGDITWIKESNQLDKIIVYGIYINEKFRSKGFCRHFLTQLIDLVSAQGRTKQIIIRAVLSKVLYEYLCRFEYKGYRFKITNGEFTCWI
jgi:hypothetical protein